MSAPDPNRGLTWGNLEDRALSLLRLPHNVVWLHQQRGLTPEQMVGRVMVEVRTGFDGLGVPVEFVGPKRFLRAVGPDNSVFGGSWWFEEEVFQRIESRLARIPLPEEHRRRMVDWRLRSGLAVSVDWNPMSELWSLELPAGQRLTGLNGRVRPQPVYSSDHPQYDPNWILAGGEMQVYFPVKNPLWVRRYR